MEETFLYLTTTGHKTGTPHRIEIWYVEFDGNYYIVSEKFEASHWVQNIRANPQITFSVGTRDLPESVIRLADSSASIIAPEKQPDLAQKVRQAMDAKYNWSDGLIVQLEGNR